MIESFGSSDAALHGQREYDESPATEAGKVSLWALETDQDSTPLRRRADARSNTGARNRPLHNALGHHLDAREGPRDSFTCGRLEPAPDTCR